MKDHVIPPADAPIASGHAMHFASVPLDFKSITIPIDLRDLSCGELMIERFARDQIGRKFYVGVNGVSGEVFVHKQHLVDRKEQDLEFNRSGSTSVIVPKRYRTRTPDTLSPVRQNGNGQFSKTL